MRAKRTNTKWMGKPKSFKIKYYWLLFFSNYEAGYNLLRFNLKLIVLITKKPTLAYNVQWS